MKKRYIFLLISVGVLGAAWYGYTKYLTSYSTKLGEVSFYKDANMELKVILIHEYLPLHYVGNTYSVACTSASTQSSPESKWYRIEAGWKKTPDAFLGNGMGDNKAIILAGLTENAKKMYQVKDTKTLVIIRNPSLSVSFDGCRSFVDFSLASQIPAEITKESTPDFEACLLQHKNNTAMNLPNTGDCSETKFSGENALTFRNIIASNAGKVSFEVMSLVFKGNQVVRFETNDSGKTWQRSILVKD